MFDFPARHLTRDGLDETAIQLESLPAFLEPLGRLIDLELHHGDRIRLEEDVRDLVQLRPKRSEEFPHDHGLSESWEAEPNCARSSRPPLGGSRRRRAPRTRIFPR